MSSGHQGRSPAKQRKEPENVEAGQAGNCLKPEEAGQAENCLKLGKYGAQIYWITIQKVPEEAFFRSAGMLSKQRRGKAEGFLYEKDRNLSLAAGILLDWGLSSYGLRERETEIACGEKGKPFLRDYPGIHFNLSHSRDMALAVFAEVETGCDIEEIQEADMALAEKFFSPGEYAYLAAQPKGRERDRAFCRIWTLKESFLKAVGAGLFLPLDSFEIQIGPEGKITVRQEGGTEARRNSGEESRKGSGTEPGRNEKRAVYEFTELQFEEYTAAICFRIFPDEGAAPP